MPKDRVTKAKAAYRMNPKSGRYCEDCSMFRPPRNDEGSGTCTLVLGPIAERGTCRFWEKRRG